MGYDFVNGQSQAALRHSRVSEDSAECKGVTFYDEKPKQYFERLIKEALSKLSLAIPLNEI